MVLNESWLQQIEAFFRRRNRPMVDRNRIQAMLPDGSAMLDNPNGTACGIRCELATPSCQLFVMPGVPKEMKPMFTEQVVPILKTITAGRVRVAGMKSFKISGARRDPGEHDGGRADHVAR